MSYITIKLLGLFNVVNFMTFLWCNFGRRSHSSEGTSGFGFELTFRLKREEGETAPPTWPAALMQALARYVFQSENNLCAGSKVYSFLDSTMN